MRDEFLVFGSPLIGQAEIDEVVDSLRSGWIGTGPKVDRFERMLEAYLGIPHVRCVSSCTGGLILGLRALGIGPGDEVVLPTMTFVASANAVELVGARPVFVDSADETGLMDLDAAERAIGPATKALMVVHLAGRPVDMDRVNAIRDRHGILVIEDAAHALGARWHGAPVGGHGNLTCYSFYATKNITTAEGGAIATASKGLADEIERQALHGLSVGAWRRYADAGFRHYTVEEPGYKFNLTDLHAALGIHQLPRLDGWIARRAELSERYDRLLQGLPLQLQPPAAPDTTHARHLYTVLLKNDAPLSRDALLDHLDRNRIGAGVHYLAVHLHPYYRDRYAIDAGVYPVAESISERTLSLPLSPQLEERDQDDVVDALASGLRPVDGTPAGAARRALARPGSRTKATPSAPASRPEPRDA